MNLVCGPVGYGSGVLLRAGEITSGLPVARLNRPKARKDTELARGPARLATALGVDLSHNGEDASTKDSRFRVLTGAPPTPDLVRSGPRTGVSGGGAHQPWRWWIDGTRR